MEQQQHKRAPLSEAQKKDKIVRSFFQNGKLVSIPVKASKRAVVLAYAAEHFFELGRTYAEPEVTAILGGFYADPCMLRRDLVDAGLLKRRLDGSAYWRMDDTSQEN